MFDTTNKRLRNTLDVFVYEKGEEKKLGVRHLKVWVISRPPKAEIAEDDYLVAPRHYGR